LAAIIILAIFAALILFANLLLDPAHIYWRELDRSPEWVIRRRKLEKLRELQKKSSVKTLFIGDSRSYNLDPKSVGLPSPAFNFTSTTARDEDFLACYKLVSKGQDKPPEFLLIGCTAPVFHPTAPLPLEASVAGDYTAELVKIGAMSSGVPLKVRVLFSYEHYRRSFKRLQWLFRKKTSRASKFQMRDDGFASWTRKSSPRDLKKHVKYFPITGLIFKSFDSIWGKRKEWWEQLLDEASQNRTKIIAYLLPGGHPDLIKRINDLDGERIHKLVADYIEKTVSEHNGLFIDLYNPVDSGLTVDDFRDGIHLLDDSQVKVAQKIADMIKREGLEIGENPGKS
jgi:hypothetical protein